MADVLNDRQGLQNSTQSAAIRQAKALPRTFSQAQDLSTKLPLTRYPVEPRKLVLQVDSWT